MQIGNAQELARLTGINVISDFRTADIEAGGQGEAVIYSISSPPEPEIPEAPAE